MDVLPHEKQIVEYEKTIQEFREQNQKNPLFSLDELQKLEKKLDKLKKQVYGALTPWERVQICRHPNRPRSIDYIEHVCEEFVELFGDRNFSDDHAVVGGLAKIDGRKFMIIGQEKGNDTDSRLYRNFGMLHPEGFRKALRLAELAEKFDLPVIFLLDTPGAYPGLTAEERGQGWAIAYNLRELARLATPIIILVIGEGCSGGALGMGVGDTIGMLEHAYYSVISPEGCASILWKDASKNCEAAATLKMQAEDLMAFSIVDHVIDEPVGGAHHNPEEIYRKVKTFILEQWDHFKAYPPEVLLERRYQKFRKMGQFDTVTDETTSEGGVSQS
ncbi:MAG: Acetyl-coenzyme A carboxylase carboxyl transferase subunit alpha [Chlamydiales bacterium]|nr:Acetyl-coenzyme A carboxylase carboxyl transferase subunit alpha [Chlamydiales bacterium]